MAECFVVGFVRKSVSYNTYRSDSSSWILTALWVAVSTNADISNDESGMAKDILLKPQFEATEQMTQNWTFRVQESARVQKLHLSDKYGESWKDWPPLRGLPTDPRFTDYPTDYPNGLPFKINQIPFAINIAAIITSI